MIAADVPRYLYQDLVGTPFLERGRDPKTGLDCYGLLMELYRRQGVTLPDPYTEAGMGYGATGDAVDHDEFLSQLFGDWTKRCGPEPGAVAVFSRYGKRPDHAGLLISATSFIHAIHYRTEPRGQIIISSLHQVPFREWFIGAYAYRH